MNNKCYIKYLYSGDCLEENQLAFDMLNANIDFAHAPISGNAMLYVNDRSYYGLSKIKEMVGLLVKKN